MSVWKSRNEANEEQLVWNVDNEADDDVKMIDAG